MRLRGPVRLALGLLGIVGVAPGCGGESTPGPAAAGDRPDVLVVVVCTLRADRLPVYGHDQPLTPHLSDLAAQSVVFDNAFALSSWTAPSMASIVTSLHPIQHGVLVGALHTRRLNHEGYKIKLNRIPEEVDTIAEVLREAGYATFGVTANPNVVEAEGFDQGFDRFHNVAQGTAEAVNEKLFEWKRQIERSDRWFVFLNYMDPHYPYHRRPPWYSGAPQDGSSVPRMDAPVDELLRAYDSEIGYLDTHLQAALDFLSAGPDTVVVFTSDHGEEFFEHGRYWHGRTLHDEVLRVPLMLHLPSVPPGRVAPNVSPVDLLPTLRDLLGLPPSDQDLGISLMPLVRGSAPEATERHIFGHLSRMMWDNNALRVERSVISGDWKYIDTTRGDGSMLFNLETDRGEQASILDEEPARAEALRARIDEFERTTRRFAPQESEYLLDPEKIKQLEALGYVAQ